MQAKVSMWVFGLLMLVIIGGVCVAAYPNSIAAAANCPHRSLARIVDGSGTWVVPVCSQVSRG